MPQCLGEWNIMRACNSAISQILSVVTAHGQRHMQLICYLIGPDWLHSLQCSPWHQQYVLYTRHWCRIAWWSQNLFCVTSSLFFHRHSSLLAGSNSVDSQTMNNDAGFLLLNFFCFFTVKNLPEASTSPCTQYSPTFNDLSFTTSPLSSLIYILSLPFVSSCPAPHTLLRFQFYLASYLVHLCIWIILSFRKVFNFLIYHCK